MKHMKPVIRKILLFSNSFLLLFYTGLTIRRNAPLSIRETVPMVLSFLMLLDILYISSCNIRESKVISLFCSLLALDNWYILLSASDNAIAGMFFSVLSPIIWYVSIHFILMFLFQGSEYRFKKAVNVCLTVTCICSLIGLLISYKIFALLYGIQFLISRLCLLFIVVWHRKRVAFVLMAEWKCILFSFVTTILLFLVYCFSTMGVPGRLANFGIYLPVLLFSMSIHSIIIKNESRRHTALAQLQWEEQLKLEFADFLHDNVLQDLLSIKNLMPKAERPDIQKIIAETLSHMNTYIREQMQEYHPVLLPKLTIKENYQNLLAYIAQSFPHRNVHITFDCPDSLFLAEPYPVFVYRLLRELITNVYRHSTGEKAWITLSQEKGIIMLCVRDDGTADADTLLSADTAKHRGLSLLTDRVNNMEGAVRITNHFPHGICIQITLPMKGDVSYQYFIS